MQVTETSLLLLLSSLTDQQELWLLFCPSLTVTVALTIFLCISNLMVATLSMTLTLNMWGQTVCGWSLWLELSLKVVIYSYNSFLFSYLWTALKLLHFDFTVGSHKTSGTSGPDKIIYSPFHYMRVLNYQTIMVHCITLREILWN